MAERRAAVVIAAEEPMVARILEHKLRREGHEVRVARSGAALTELLHTAAADVVLLDARVSATAPAARAGWLAIIEGRDADAARAAMQLGAAGLVRTPFKPTEVAEQVTTLLRMVVA